MRKHLAVFVFTSLLASMVLVPVSHAAALPAPLASSWSQLLSVLRLKLTGISNQVAADQAVLNMTATQLVALRTQLNLLASTSNEAARQQILNNAQTVVTNATVQVSAISKRWEAYSDVLRDITPTLTSVVAGIRELLAK